MESKNPPRKISPEELTGQVREAVRKENLHRQKVLAIIPDNTRTAPVGLLFKTLGDLFREGGGTIDYLLALGTHPPMSEAEITTRLEMDAAERKERFPGTRVFNHCWNDPRALADIGGFSAREMSGLSGGLYREGVRVLVNRRVLEYPRLLIAGPVFPHEVVGFSGGNKYLFPGVSGPEFLNAFHWLGALITNPKVNGTPDTAVKGLINRATAFIKTPITCFALVMRGEETVGFFAGGVEEAWRSAVALSRKVNIAFRPRPYRCIFSHIPPMYRDFWLAGKGMYKVEPVAADDAEVIIYAPHIREISHTHGEVLARIGYHTRDYFLAQPEKFADIPGGIKAHSTHVKGIGTYRNGREYPRVRVTLATAIPEETCRRINLGYRDPATLNPDDFKGREAEGVLYVAKAGEVLYRLADGTVPEIERLGKA